MRFICCSIQTLHLFTARKMKILIVILLLRPVLLEAGLISIPSKSDTCVGDDRKLNWKYDNPTQIDTVLYKVTLPGGSPTTILAYDGTTANVFNNYNVRWDAENGSITVVNSTLNNSGNYSILVTYLGPLSSASDSVPLQILDPPKNLYYKRNNMEFTCLLDSLGTPSVSLYIQLNGHKKAITTLTAKSTDTVECCVDGPAVGCMSGNSLSTECRTVQSPTTTTPATNPASTTATPTTTKAPTTSTTPAAATSVPTSTSAAATTPSATSIASTNTPSTLTNKSTTRTVTETSSSKSSNDTDDVAAIVGGSVGGALFLFILLGVALAVCKCRKSSKKPMDPNTAKHRSAKHHRHGGNGHTRKLNDRTLKSTYQSNQDRPFYGQYINPAYDGHDNNWKVVSGYHGFQPNPPPYTVYDPFSGEYVRSTDHRGSYPMVSGQRYTLHQPSQQRARLQPTGYQLYASGRPGFHDYSGSWDFYY